MLYLPVVWGRGHPQRRSANHQMAKSGSAPEAGNLVGPASRSVPDSVALVRNHVGVLE
jgi:hypothetical protein